MNSAPGVAPTFKLLGTFFLWGYTVLGEKMYPEDETQERTVCALLLSADVMEYITAPELCHHLPIHVYHTHASLI